MRIGIGIGDIAGAPAGVDDLVAQARRAEADGFASGWFANIFGIDAIMAATLCARETKTIELGTAEVFEWGTDGCFLAFGALFAAAVQAAPAKTWECEMFGWLNPSLCKQKVAKKKAKRK